MTSSPSQIFFGIFVCAILSFQMVLSAPLLAAASAQNNQNNNAKKFMQLPSYNYPIEEMEMFKRDFEEPLFIDPLTAENENEGDEFPVFYNLPRTDRKNFGYFNNNNNNQMFQFNGGENPFENLPIDLRSIPDTVETEELSSPPSQKEFLGPIVVGPQTRSTQTNSAKKN